jgi:hypothetical protein
MGKVLPLVERKIIVDESIRGLLPLLNLGKSVTGEGGN